MPSKDKAGETWAINVNGHARNEKVELTKASKIVSDSRWVYVNASLKDVEEAREEATRLSDFVDHPMVLVYMPRHIFDGQRNDYNPAFVKSLLKIVKDIVAEKKELLVSARSYGVHQALNVVRQVNSPLVLVEGIAPAFGAFGNEWSDNVKKYIDDVEKTRSKYCMIASRDDNFTWKSGGAVYWEQGGWLGDEDVGKAMKRNEKNVVTLVLDKAEHTPIDSYLEHGLLDMMRKGVKYFGLEKGPLGDIVYRR